MEKKKVVERAADNIRILSAAMVEKAKSGHPGGAMGGADFINILFTEFLNYDPEDMIWPNRDRFFLDPGHMSPMLYAVLTLMGHYTIDEIKAFRQWESPTPGHPELDVERGVENTSGPLGQGHTFAVGAAIAEKFLCARFGRWMSHKIYTFVSDGGIQEEIAQGAGRLAGHLGLNNLIMFFDSNDIQLSTGTDAVTSEDTAKKYRAWGWRVIVVNKGNDAEKIREALKEASKEKEKPVLIIGKTIMGKGAVTEDGRSFERMCETHGMPLGKAGASFEKTVQKLGGEPNDPFAVFQEVAEYYAKARQRKTQNAAKKKQKQAGWEKKNPKLAKKFRDFFSVRVPDIDYANITQKEGIATRAASKTLLAHFAEKVENMIVGSADLSNSDNTDGFLKKSRAFKKGDFSGGFLQAGVSELTLAAIMNGIALHGGIIPVCGTFFVFSDYMKPAVRLAALMGLPVKYVWTHDAFRVGEDGPTHQPVEQEAQIRLLEQMKNHSGRRSLLALRPADATETTVAWKIAMENTTCPSALLLSRQVIADIPPRPGSSRYQDALEASRGAYVVKEAAGRPDIVLVANGSEVSTLIAAVQKLPLNVQIVSAPSEGLFREQDLEYQKRVVPDGLPVLGLTAGLPAALKGLVGPFGKVIGVDHFGYSAPFKVLDEKFGFTPENVAKQVEIYLEEYRNRN
jgi:transketolase